MNDQITAGAAAIAGALVAGTGLARWAVTPPREKVSFDDLLGPPTAYTTGFEHADSPIRTGFAYCQPCGCTTAGSWNKDGWLCGQCLTPAPAGGV
jgi:hypothetical protein